MNRLEEVFLDSYASLKALVNRYLKRPEDVEDILQETFIRTFEADRESRILNLRGYLFRTARNLSFNHQALHANRLTSYLGDIGVLELDGFEPPPENRLEAHEQFSIFCEAVAGLPLQCQRVLILKKVYGLSHDEIAKRLGITVSTTNQHLAKGLARCTWYMRERGYLEDRAASRERAVAHGDGN
jgi:RNA polymerase sigma-70 factor (ECF subfamily)